MINSKAPDFTETDVEAWFAILESQFILRKIKTNDLKFHNTLAALPTDVFSKIPMDVIKNAKYEELKSTLLASYERSYAEIMAKFMKTTSLSRRPSQFLQEIMTMANKLNVGSDIIWHKFLEALPPSVAILLATRSDLSLEQLGKVADQIFTYHGSKNPVNAITERGDISSRNRNSWQESRTRTPNDSIPRGVQPYSPDQRPKVCRAHIYFADKANNCTSWCKWPNKQNCQIQQCSCSASPAYSRSSSPRPCSPVKN
jgi:hypothetical protein